MKREKTICLPGIKSPVLTVLLLLTVLLSASGQTAGNKPCSMQDEKTTGIDSRLELLQKIEEGSPVTNSEITSVIGCSSDLVMSPESFEFDFFAGEEGELWIQDTRETFLRMSEEMREIKKEMEKMVEDLKKDLERKFNEMKINPAENLPIYSLL